MSDQSASSSRAAVSQSRHGGSGSACEEQDTVMPECRVMYLERPRSPRWMCPLRSAPPPPGSVERCARSSRPITILIEEDDRFDRPANDTDLVQLSHRPSLPVGFVLTSEIRLVLVQEGIGGLNLVEDPTVAQPRRPPRIGRGDNDESLHRIEIRSFDEIAKAVLRVASPDPGVFDPVGDLVIVNKQASIDRRIHVNPHLDARPIAR